MNSKRPYEITKKFWLILGRMELYLWPLSLYKNVCAAKMSKFSNPLNNL